MKSKTWLVRCRVTGLNGERLLNAAQKQGIPLEKVKREQDRSLTVTLAPAAYEAFSALAREKGYQVSAPESLGGFRAIRRLLRRWGGVAGALLSAGLLVWSLGYVWAVRVENAGPYAGEVRSFLEENGIRPGVRKSAVRLSDLRDRLEWRLPKVQWVRAEWAGVTLRVRLEPGTPAPELPDGAPGDVVAAQPGMIYRITAFAGTAKVKAGDFVQAGQVLIRGQERGENGALIPVRARGEVIARGWISRSVRLPMTEVLTVPTGRETSRRIIETPFFSWSREAPPAYLTSDVSRDILPVGGVWAPVRLIRETCAEAALERRERDQNTVKEEGKKAAVFALEQALAGKETVDKWINFSMIEGDTMTVTATAEIRRDIGAFQEQR